jgi:hypothetical protein
MVLTMVDDLDLTYKVPAPVTGGTPAEYLSAPQYAGNVTWNPTMDGGLFEKGVAYKATMTLMATSGFTFADVKDAFTHEVSDQEPKTNLVNGVVTVTIEFPATTDRRVEPVTDLDLTGKIPVPAAEDVPVWYFFPPESPQYTGYVVWSTSDLTASGLFQEDMIYTATVTLTAASGFTFNDVGENAFIHARATENPANEANSGVVTIVFPKVPKNNEGNVGWEQKW